MDDRDLVRATRNSFRAGRSRADVLSGFQNRGYKLAYAQEIIDRALRPRRVLVISVLVFLIVSVFSLVLFINLSPGSGGVTGLASLQRITGSAVSKPVIPPRDVVVSDDSSVSIPSLDDSVRVDASFVSDLLVLIGADSLRRNYLTFQDPIINVRFGDQLFHSVVRGGVRTSVGLHDDADIEFDAPTSLVSAVSASSDPRAVLRDSISKGHTKVHVRTSQANLFAKGYLNLYDSLK